MNLLVARRKLAKKFYKVETIQYYMKIAISIKLRLTEGDNCIGSFEYHGSQGRAKKVSKNFFTFINNHADLRLNFQAMQKTEQLIKSLA